MTPEDLVLLRQARDQMDRDYAQPLDVPALARTALMSPGHFSRSFRRTGVSRSEFTRSGLCRAAVRRRCQHVSVLLPAVRFAAVPGRIDGAFAVAAGNARSGIKGNLG